MCLHSEFPFIFSVVSTYTIYIYIYISCLNFGGENTANEKYWLANGVAYIFATIITFFFLKVILCLCVCVCVVQQLIAVA